MRRRLGWVLVVSMMVLAAVVLASGITAEMVGANRCRECHSSAYRVWENSAHKRAHPALPPENQKDQRCEQCHGTAEETVGSVQCESCHGAGRHYARSNVMKDPELARIVGLVDVNEEVCRRCHNESTPSVRPFDFSNMWKAISHGLDGRESNSPEH
jgi:hypothetical protein